MDEFKIGVYNIGKKIKRNAPIVSFVEICEGDSSVITFYRYIDGSYNLYEGKGFV